MNSNADVFIYLLRLLREASTLLCASLSSSGRLELWKSASHVVKTKWVNPNKV